METRLKESLIRELYELEETHWWFVAKRRLITEICERYFKAEGGAALDIGSGAGRILMDLEKIYGLGVGLDSSPAAIGFCRARGLKNLVTAQAEAGLPFKTDCFSAVVCSDVLEHLDRDADVLKEIYRITAPEGGVAISVPAAPEMFGYWDELHEHKRRYSKESLRELVSAAGFKIELLSFSNFFIYAPAKTVRRLKMALSGARGGENVKSDLGITSKPIGVAMSFVYGIERKLILKTGLPAGLSLVCVARKT
ncbi:MAG TPA: methyltransferase domain-containing protein [bacterium]|nr:methyltransferase domain-containing protein [bacterium]